MPELPVDALLAPLTEDSPCGEDLAYDPAFLALEDAARGKAEQQFGDKVIAAREPDWPVVKELALSLLQRTRDLRVAILLTRADARTEGFGGFASGVRRVRGLLERHWDHVHPQLDASDHNDPTMRLSALDPLVDERALLADLRQAVVGSARGGMSVRQIELGLGKAEAGSTEHVPTPAGVATALAAAAAQVPGALEQVVELAGDVRAIEQIVDTKLGAANTLDLRPLRLLTHSLAEAAQAAVPSSAEHPHAAVEGASPDPVVVAGSAKTSTGGALNSRDDVIKMLDAVCEWIARNEPTNPAPLLIRRAQRLMTKTFMEIVRDIAPDGLKDVERLAGADAT